MHSVNFRSLMRAFGILRNSVPLFVRRKELPNGLSASRARKAVSVVLLADPPRHAGVLPPLFLRDLRYCGGGRDPDPPLGEIDPVL